MDRTVPPTPRRLLAARRAGDGPLSAAAVRVAPVALIAVMGPSLAGALTDRFRVSIRAALNDPAHASPQEALSDVLVLAAPFCVAAAAASLATSAVLLGGFVSRRHAETPRPPRGAGLGAYDSLRGAAAVVVGGVASTIALASSAPDLADALGSSGAVVPAAARAVSTVLLAVLGALGGIALVDVVVQRAAFHARWRMTPREAALDRRESEGDPEISTARRRIHEESARA
ncbi:MAG TPA: EscU/YscU/HrcU family type III secretion system export apparatus switch protein [Polyangiaceae bacterium]|nr:EscU/YscU/HrcU family type III secretion system export apparatus switch protein [Polyangiaceae bacterium]